MPSNKRCGTCKRSQALTAFNKRRASPDGLQPTCRTCNKAASKAYYRRNPVKHKREVTRHKKARIAANRQFLLDYLLSHPCIDCGETDPVVLDFDHVRGEKIRNVGDMSFRPTGLARLQSEIAKCEIRCVNCHRRRTAHDQSWWQFEQ